MPPPSPAPSPFAAAYSEALKELTTTELSKIRLLRDLARENPAEAAHILSELMKHMKTCPVSCRLPALYLLDCIMKTAEGPYPDLVAFVLPQVFASLWDGAPPDLQAKLAKTATTWKELPSVPSGTMSLIQAKMQPPQQSLLFNGNLRAGMQQYSGPGSAMQPIMLAPAAPAMQHPGMFAPQPLVTYQQLPQQMQYMQQQAFSASNPLLAAAAAAASTGGSNLAAHLLNLGQKLVGQLPTAQGAGGGTANQAASDPAVKALMAASAQTRGKFLDLQFLRNRRQAVESHRVRPWFVEVEKWLLGTQAVGETVAHFAEEEEGVGADGQGGACIALVEEDPSQPACAISGEPFERTYDPETNKWYYEDAVVLSREQATLYGVMEGSIVKAPALAGAPPVLANSVGLGLPGPSAHKARSLHDVFSAMARAAESAGADTNATIVVTAGGPAASGDKRVGLGLGEQASKRSRVLA